MKAVLTFLFVFSFVAMALANTETDVKMDGMVRGIVLVAGTQIQGVDVAPQIKIDAENRLARLYKLQNSRIKKALSFATTHSKAKWA